TDIVLTPSAALTDSFVLNNVEAGTHYIKAITESLTGVVSAEERVASIVIAPPATTAPSSFTGLFFHPDSDDLLVAWSDVATPAGLQPRYVLEFRNSTDTATLAAVTVIPSPLTEASEA